MASGKSNYFRHSIFASEDSKVQTLIESMGFEGYGFYFSLLELCGRQCADEVKNPIKFHINTIRKVWRKNTESAKKVLRKLEESGLFVLTFSGDSVEIDIPSFGKYLGRYEKSGPNKRKEIKEKKRNSEAAAPAPVIVALVEPEAPPKKNLPKRAPKEKPKTPLFEAEPLQLEEEVSLSDLARNAITAINTICGKSFRPTTAHMRHINARINEGYKFEDFVKVLKHKQAQWGHDPKMSAYLRPETIFGTKFDGYLQEAIAADKPKIDPLRAFLEEHGITRSFYMGEESAS